MIAVVLGSALLAFGFGQAWERLGRVGSRWSRWLRWFLAAVLALFLMGAVALTVLSHGLRKSPKPAADSTYRRDA